MEEVYPNIFMITEYGAFGAVMPPVNIYVLAGADGLIFDSGYARKGILSHLKKEMQASKQGSITVFALDGKAVTTVAALEGFTAGMKALDKRLGKKTAKHTKK